MFGCDSCMFLAVAVAVDALRQIQTFQSSDTVCVYFACFVYTLFYHQYWILCTPFSADRQPRFFPLLLPCWQTGPKDGRICPLVQHFTPRQHTSKSIWQIAMRFGDHLSVFQRINPVNFGDLMTLLLLYPQDKM